MGDLLIINGEVINHDHRVQADVLIKDGKIQAIERGLKAPPNVRTIDASGKLVIPGGIDPHTHLQCPYQGTITVDDFDGGTRAAVAGGTTTILDFASPERGKSLIDTYNLWRSWADPKVNCDYALHMIVPEWNERVASEMEQLVKSHGVTSFKAFMAFDDLILSDSELYNLFKKSRELGALCLVHAENGALITEGQKKVLQAGVTGPEGHELSRPEEVEAEATHRAITIADQSELAAEEVQRARAQSKKVWGEVLAAALGVDGRRACHVDWKTAARFIMSPPLRSSPLTKLNLAKALASGVLQCVATDNCTYDTAQKLKVKDDFTQIPSGVNGLEDRLSIVWEMAVASSGLLTPMEFVAATSTNAARIFNIFPRKGCIRVGSDADIVIWDPNASRKISAATHHHQVDFNIFEGMVVRGVAEKTIHNGRVVWENNTLFTKAGSGRYLSRPSHGLVYEGIPHRLALADPKLKRVVREEVEDPPAPKKSS